MMTETADIVIVDRDRRVIDVNHVTVGDCRVVVLNCELI